MPVRVSPEPTIQELIERIETVENFVTLGGQEITGEIAAKKAETPSTTKTTFVLVRFNIPAASASEVFVTTETKSEVGVFRNTAAEGQHFFIPIFVKAGETWEWAYNEAAAKPTSVIAYYRFIGAVGSQGPTGAKGETGPKGETGEKGGILTFAEIVEKLEKQLLKVLLTEKIEKVKKIIGETLEISKIKKIIGEALEITKVLKVVGEGTTTSELREFSLIRGRQVQAGGFSPGGIIILGALANNIEPITNEANNFEPEALANFNTVNLATLKENWTVTGWKLFGIAANAIQEGTALYIQNMSPLGSGFKVKITNEDIKSEGFLRFQNGGGAEIVLEPHQTVGFIYQAGQWHQATPHT